MSQLAFVNDVAESKLLPLQKFSQLTKGSSYQVLAIRQVNTKFGKGITVDLLPLSVLGVPINDQRFSTFLPKRMTGFFEKNKMAFEDLVQTSNAEKLMITYIGGPINDFKFEEMEADIDSIVDGLF